jgi:protein-disulfide isomerase
LSRLLGGRRRPAFLAAVTLFAASLIGASLIGSREATPSAAPALPSSFAGIPQSGAVLGHPRVKVTLVEYPDLQCPYCAEWTHRTLPVLVDEYVRTGKVRIVFRGLAFIGPESERALRVTFAAGRQNRFWNVLEALYHRQGAENSGWVTEQLLEEVAGTRALTQSNAPWVDRQLAQASRAAQTGGAQGTPAFQVGRTGGPLQLVPLNSLGPEGLRPALESALAS